MVQISSSCFNESEQAATTLSDAGAVAPTSSAISQSVISQSKNIPGNMAVWVLIYAELSEFALFFIIFLFARAYNQELFSEGPSQLNMLAGLTNTVILLTSSYFVARAVRAMQSGDQRTCVRWLCLTLLAGAAYCGVKGWEYYWNEAAGFNARTDLFFSSYYYLTFNHLLHVLIGMCVILFATIRTQCGHYDQIDHEGLECAACYWHMIDLAWIIIFPLLYVLN